MPNVSTRRLAAAGVVAGEGAEGWGEAGDRHKLYWSGSKLAALLPPEVQATSASALTLVCAGRQHLVDVLDGQRGVQQAKHEEGGKVLAHQHRVEANHGDVGCAAEGEGGFVSGVPWVAGQRTSE